MSTPTPTDLTRRLQTLTDDYQKLQSTLDSAISARQKLSAQEQENLSVQREFSGLTESQTVYKMIGPVLLRQDRGEAVLSVEGRLEFIGKEIERVEGQIKTSQDKIESKREEIYEVQMVQQQMQGSAQAQQVAA